MGFISLKEYLEFLKKEKELHIIEEPVNAELETTQIAIKALLEEKPALLFTNVIGSDYPLAMNLYASDKRVELALMNDPDTLGAKLIKFVHELMPPRISSLTSNKEIFKRFTKAIIPKSKQGNSQKNILDPDLNKLPVIKTWPKDGGRFITLPQVFTYDPVTGKRNVGMYRMQVFDKETTGIHWQIQKGGGFHYFQSEKLNRDMEMAVAIGTDPALLFATIAALPENIDEVMFASFLRGKRTSMVKAKTINLKVPAYAEFILEGVVPAHKRRMEGPFGDHFGHYSAASEFPYFNIRKITTSDNPVYTATCVGIPPMEDKFLGDATQKILGPLIKLIHPEINELWAYYEAGFHNLLVISVDERYHKESVKTALSVMGEGQLSLTKCVVLVDKSVDPRNFNEVLTEIKNNFDPYFDFIMIPKVPLDTLDFTSFKMNLGSKAIIDATSNPERPRRNVSAEDLNKATERLKKQIYGIKDYRILQDTMLVVKTEQDGKPLLEKLLEMDEFQVLNIIAIVSDDVDLNSTEKIIWGIFTRFDAERDILFTEQKLSGICPIYKGVMGIDATWKKGYPEALKMDEDIIGSVDAKWHRLFK